VENIYLAEDEDFIISTITIHGASVVKVNPKVSN
jgi:hypothetical protein